MADVPASRRDRRRLRWAVRCAVLVAAGIAIVGVLPWEGAVAVVPAASPFVTAATALATRSVGVLALAAAPVLLLAILGRRWFCRWACPVGLLSETLGGVRRGKGPGLARWPAVGQWVLLVTLGGAALGYPMLVWVDPLAMFSAAVGAWLRPLGLVTLLACLPLLLVLLVSVIAPGLWCGRLCPLGGMQDLLALPGRLFGRRRAPLGDTEAAANPAPGERDSGWAFGRRAFLGVGAGGAVALATEAAGRGTDPPVRPPGGATEDRFVGLCIRCGNCVRACPSGILRPDLGMAGVAGLLAPRAVFRDGFCAADCNACGRVCPSGAIAPLALAEKRQRVMGLAEVQTEKCVLAGGQECGVCVSACPYEAVDIVEPEAAFPAYPYPRVLAAKCVGCGACEYECPTAPPRAIRVVAGSGTLADRV